MLLLLLEPVRGRKRLPRNWMQTSRLQVFDFEFGDISAGRREPGSNSGACALCLVPCTDILGTYLRHYTLGGLWWWCGGW